MIGMRDGSWQAALFLGVALCLLESGCGGGSSVPSTPTPVPTGPSITSIAVTPETALIGTQVQFAATVAGTGAFSSGVTWSVAGPAGSALSPGTIAATGLYTTPYPAPPTVTVTATSTEDTTKSGSATVSLSAPVTAAGPALTVDAGNQTHPISPFIYGMNSYTLDEAAEKAISLPVDRWGGDGTSLYNYQLDVSNAGSDWYFQNSVGATGQQETSAFNAQVESDAAIGAKTMGTVPLEGWVAKDGTSCSFPASIYPSQYQFDPYDAACGDGELPNPSNPNNPTNVTGNDPTLTATPVGPSWTGTWVSYLVNKFGTAAQGGVAIYDLDNEPDWWDGEHRDVHPQPFTYDELTNSGIAAALAVKTADPTAEVSGPVMVFWWDLFYSKKDVEAGWVAGGGPCYQPWSNPADRKAHNGTPLIEYYLQQFAAYQAAHNLRLLDYLDLHSYLAATYNGNTVGLTTAGDTGEQEARLNSTRALWDPAYTDPNYAQPNYITDANYTSSCTLPLQAPQFIPMAQSWIAKDYAGTKLAFSEYNWGGQEHINGALAQADVLGIFGRYGVDLATLWGPPDPVKQVPGLMAFEVFRNYDGHGAMFGDMAISSTSVDQGKLSVYGALRTSDNMVTLIVINKTYGDLTSTLSVNNLPATTTSAKAYLYSNANLNAIVAQPNVTVMPPTGGGTASTIGTTFRAQSITLLVMPGS
jgi:hypothetical protein